MTRTPSILAAALAATTLLAACAGTPPASDLAADTAPGTAARTAGAGAPDCAALQVQITQAGDAQRQAAQKQHDAWRPWCPWPRWRATARAPSRLRGRSSDSTT